MMIAIPSVRLTYSQLVCFGYGLVLAWMLSASVYAASASQDTFWDNLSGLCGDAFGGQVSVFDPAADQGWLNQAMGIHVKHCDAKEIRIALNVGENRSRTWVFTRTDTGIALQHDHRHEDGSQDVLSFYGGHTSDGGQDWRQAFVVDGYSQSLFYAQGLDVSAGNIWYVELHPGQTLAYGLTRPNRHFRVEFDLTQTIETPPKSWGDTRP